MKILLQKIFDRKGLPAIAEQAVFFLTGLQIFFNPLPQINAVHEFSFYLSLLILVYLFSCQKESRAYLKSPLTLPFGLFILWSVIGLPFALNQPNSIHDVYAHLIKYTLLYYFVIFIVRTEAQFLRVTWLITTSSVLFSIGIMIHYYIILGNGWSTRLGVLTYSEMPTNIIPTITVFAAIIATCHLVRAKSLRNRVIAAGFIAICLTATLATQSKGALIAFAVGMLSFLSFNKKKLALFVLACGLVTGILQTSFHYFTPMLARLGEEPRIGIWYNYVEMIKEHPITGIGFGMQTYEDDALLKKYNDQVPAAYRGNLLIRAPHNLFIDVAVRTGWVGLGLFLMIMISFLRMGWALMKKQQDSFISDWERCCVSSFMALLIQGMLENILSGPPAVILYVIFALATILQRMTQTPTGKPGSYR